MDGISMVQIAGTSQANSSIKAKFPSEQWYHHPHATLHTILQTPHLRPTFRPDTGTYSGDVDFACDIVEQH